MGTLQQRQYPIDLEIAQEVIAITPEWWRSAVLELAATTAPDGTEALSHSISSPDGHRDVVIPTDELFAATRSLVMLFREYGTMWKRATYTVRLDDAEAWQFTATFEYSSPKEQLPSCSGET